MRRRALLLALVCALSAAAALAAGPEIRRETVQSGGKPRTYWLFVPDGASGPRPLLLLLHGSGRNGETLVKPWRDLAEKEGIILAAPDAADPKWWTLVADGPAFLRDVVEAVRAKTPIDPRRMFLFGHSAGAVFALQMAAFESEYFAAVAIHAGALPAGDFATFDWATRKIPYAIWIGTRDAFFPIDAARATRDALATRGFEVAYVEMPGHTHDYYGSAREVNRDAWKFFQAHPLKADPKYSAYGGTR